MKESVAKTEFSLNGAHSEEPLSRVNLCFQCRKCSCGCPVNVEMDFLPHQVMRMLQLGENRAVLNTQTIWVCVGCQTCSSRCPNDIDIAGVMDSCRHAAALTGETSQKNIKRFHKVFLNEIRRRGRIHELSLIGRYKLLSGQWFQDIPMGLKMFAKRKLRIIPGRIRGRKVLRKLFTEMEKKS